MATEAETASPAAAVADDSPAAATAAAVSEANRLYAEGRTEQLYDFLQQFRDSDNSELLWRLCRAAYHKGKLIGKDPEKKKLYYEARDIIQRALELGPNSAGTNKWYGAMLSFMGDYEGTKKKIENAFKIKEHFDKAHALDPSDAGTLFLIGKWCFALADMPWMQRKIASALFATPPESTYQEALDYFQKAESTSPGFKSDNRLMIGLCLMKLGQKDEARPHVQTAHDALVISPDDKETHEQAVQLLKRW